MEATRHLKNSAEDSGRPIPHLRKAAMISQAFAPPCCPFQSFMRYAILLSLASASQAHAENGRNAAGSLQQEAHWMINLRMPAASCSY